MSTQNLTSSISKVNNFNNLVFQNENGTLTTTSLKIAEIFGRNHKEILRTTEKLLNDLPEDWGKRNFAHTPYVHPQNGQTYPMVTLTRDAFSLLVMGFTGEKALQWKLKYIEAFNDMEQALRNKEIAEYQQIADQYYIDGFDNGRESGLKDIELAKEVSYQQGMEYGQSLPCVQIETQKSYLQGLTEGRKIQKAEDNKKQDNWQKMEKAIDYLGKGVSLKDTARLVKLCPGTIRNRFRRLGLWEQVKNGDLWFNMPGKKQKSNCEQPQQLSLL